MLKILTIAGSDSGGAAGVQADIKTVTALGGYAMSAITALTAQNTVGVKGVLPVEPGFVAAQIEAVAGDIGVDAAKTGMLANAGVIEAVAAKVAEHAIGPLVVDPVMVSTSGHRLLDPQAEAALVRRLLPLARVITPNLAEASVMLGGEVKTEQDMAEAARALCRLGAAAAIVTGGHAPGDAVDILFDGRELTRFSAPRVETENTHGSGCTFSAALSFFLARGHGLAEAARLAKGFVTQAVIRSLSLGAGHGPTNHLAPAERLLVLARLNQAYQRLNADERSGELVAEVQLNLGYALEDARGVDEVAAFPGRVIRLGGRAVKAADPAFGASRHVARIILTFMARHPQFRAGLNVRYDDTFIERARKLGLKIGEFSRALEPPELAAAEGSTLEWGVEEVLKGGQGLPDLIIDQGGMGKEPMIRVLGRDPLEAVEKALGLLG